MGSLSRLFIPVFAFFVAASCVRQGEQAEYFSASALPSHQIPSPQPSVSAQNRRISTPIVWAGLSGMAPRYIDAGSKRGFGWMEYQTRGIRKYLESEGIELKMEYMTPARIEHEFRKKSPICFYPVEWKDPKATFSKPVDRIYSIPLDLGGDTSRKVIFRREDLPVFRKHLDRKGDILLDSLLRDPQLKTVLVRNRDYGLEVGSVLDVDSQGDQIVRPEFRRSVSLLLTRENVQILEMLNAKRFDYTFSDAIEGDDFATAKIDRSRFLEIGLSTVGVESVQDSQLTLVSVACSLHPTSLLTLPYINESIRRLRGREWFSSKVSYRKKIDLSSASIHDAIELLYNSKTYRFKGDFASGKTDEWYGLQVSKVPGLKLWPEAEPVGSEFQRDFQIKVPKWHAALLGPSDLVIVNDAFTGLSDSTWVDINRAFLSPDRVSSAYFTESEREYLAHHRYLTATQGADRLSELALPSVTRVKRLVFFARGALLPDLEKIKSILSAPDLREVLILGAGTAESRALVSWLPRHLTLLNLTGSSLSASGIENLIAQVPLRSLHLNDSQLTPNQMVQILESLNQEIQELSLGWLRSSWSEEAAKTFARRKFSHLRYLDLDLCNLFDSHVVELAKGLFDGLETLHLGSSSLTSEGAQAILTRSLPRLRELDLSGPRHGSGASFVFSVKSPVIRFPKQLKKLALAHTNLTRMNQAEWPDSLTDLDLSQNLLATAGFSDLIGHLSPNMAELSLNATLIGKPAFEEIFRSGRLAGVMALSLNSNGIGDELIEKMAAAHLRLKALNLNDNKITDVGAKTIAETWMSELRSLSLRDNLIAEEGMSVLARRFGPSLRRINLSANNGIQASSLAPYLPKALESLDLSDLYLSEGEVLSLAKFLPPSLQELRLGNSFLKQKGIQIFGNALPHHLKLLALENVNLGGTGQFTLLKNIPASLSALFWGDGQLYGKDVLDFAKGLPQGIAVLFLKGGVFDAGTFGTLLSNLPPGLRDLRIYSVQLKSKSATWGSKGAVSWPSSLRQFKVYGSEVGAKNGIQLFGKLPPSLESLELEGIDLKESDWTGILGLGYAPLFNLSLRSCNLTGLRIVKVFKEFRSLFVVELDGFPEVTLSDLKQLSRKDLKRLIDLEMSGGRLPDLGIASLLDLLDPNLDNLYLKSNGLTGLSVEHFIRNFPPGIRTLILTGNPIGEVGLGKLRAYQKERERRNGFSFDLLE